MVISARMIAVVCLVFILFAFMVAVRVLKSSNARPHWRGASRLLEYKQNATAASSAGRLFGFMLTCA
jgi:hypothetical protein